MLLKRLKVTISDLYLNKNDVYVSEKVTKLFVLKLKKKIMPCTAKKISYWA